MVNTIATDLSLHLKASPSVDMKLLNNYQMSADGYVLPDLAEGGVVWALFKVKIPKEHLNPNPFEVFVCSLSFKTVDAETLWTEPARLVLNLLPQSVFESRLPKIHS